MKIIKKIYNYLVFNFTLFKNKGSKYTCPFCNYSSEKLNPIGLKSEVITRNKIIGAGLRNGACLKCGSVDRVRLLFLFLKNEYRIFDKGININILHIAPEKQISEKFHQLKFKNYVCGDYFTEGYSYPSYVQNMNILNLQFKDNYFDFLLCNHVLEHITNDIEAMKEIFRVLKKNSSAILQVPISFINEKTIEDDNVTSPEGREKNYGQYDHVRIYGKDYIHRLESVGFKVETIDIAEKYQKYGVIENEIIFLVTK